MGVYMPVSDEYPIWVYSKECYDRERTSGEPGPANPGLRHDRGEGTIPQMTASPAETSNVKLEIAGMSCASCAVRIEERLNRLDGVNATVSYATETATVTTPAGYDPNALYAEVKKAGYTAVLPHHHVEAGAHDASGDPELASLRRRVVASLVLATPVIALAMIPALQFGGWQWASLALAAPVVLWAGWPFHAAAWANLKHGTATMDTLISIGTLSAFRRVAVRPVPGTAGNPHAHHHFQLTATRSVRRQYRPRSGCRRDAVRPGRPLLREARQTPRGRRITGLGRAGRQRCRGAAPRSSPRRSPKSAIRSGLISSG